MQRTATREPYLTSLGRALVGAIFFALPLLMTMEMWELGVGMDRTRLALFLAFGVLTIFGLSNYAGFRPTRGLKADLLDTFTALLIGFLVSAVLLTLFGVYQADPSPMAVAGKTGIQMVPAAMGAILARRQLSGGSGEDGGDANPEDAPGSTYAGELFLMAAGALFIAFNVAPTEEVILINYRMGLLQTLGLVALSLGLLHAVVYTLGFAGQHSHHGHGRAFIHFTVPGYAIALLISLYVLWSFGRTDGWSPHEVASTMIVLGFPAALGAALARLVV